MPQFDHVVLRLGAESGERYVRRQVLDLRARSKKWKDAAFLERLRQEFLKAMETARGLEGSPN